MAIKIKGQVVIDDNQNIVSSGEATATNFKTGTTNVHSSGIEVSGINVLGGNTPIGSEALIYDNGDASFVNVTATTYYGDGSNLTGLFSGAYDDLTGKPSIPTYTSNLVNDSGFITNTNSTFPSNYYEFGDAHGSVSNDGNWHGRLNVAGSSHARIDATSVSDGIITSMFSHTGVGAGKVGTMSNHQLDFMIDSISRASLSTAGSLSSQVQGILWGSANDGSGSGLDADVLDGQEGSYYLDYNNLNNKPTNVSSLTNDSGYQTESQVDAKIAAIPPTDLSSYDTSTQVDNKISTAVSGVDLSAYDTSAEVTAKINTLETSLISGAPGALDTLNELAAALGDDSNFASTVTNSLATKANLSGATFTGAVIQGQLTAGGTGGNYLSNGEVAAYGPTSSAHLWRGWDVSGSSNVLTSSVKADGSAEFVGNVAVGSISPDYYCQVTRPGGAQVTLGGSDDYALWTLNSTAVIKYDGSAEFSGKLQVNNQSEIYRPAAAGGSTSGNTLLAFKSDVGGTAVTKAFITTDGAANFASHLITGSENSVNSTSAHGSYIGEGIVVNAIQPNATLAAQERVWLGKLANVTKSQIFKDGSATFAGGNATIDANGSAAFQAGVDVRTQDGQRGLTVNSSSSSQNQALKINNNGGSQVILLNHDGSAEFAGPQTLATPSSPATNGYTSHIDNTEASTAACYSANNHNAHGINFLGVDGGNSNAITCKIMNDGSAEFVGSVESKNNFFVKAQANDQTCFRVTDLSGGTIRTNLRGDGSASFATTNIDIASTGQLTIKKTAPFTDPSFRILDRNNSNADGVLMYGDGSASFAGTVDAAGFTVNGSPMSSAVGGLSFAYTYDSSFSGSSNGGPVHGKLVTSNTNLDNSTTVIHPSFRDGDNVELTSFYQSLSGGYLKVSSASDSSQYSLFSISSVDDYSAWFGINVTRIGGTVTTFSDETDVILSFDASGGGAGAAGSSDAATLAGMLPSTDSTADTIAQRHDNGSLSMTYAYASWVRARTDINSAFDPAAFVVMSDGWYYHLNKDDMKSALDVGFIPQRYTDTAYTLAADDKGKHIKSSGQNITVPAGVFSTGDVVTIYNYSYGSATLTQGSGVTMYHAGSNGSTGNRSMANFALATILCTGSDEFVVSGTGVS